MLVVANIHPNLVQLRRQLVREQPLASAKRSRAERAARGIPGLHVQQRLTQLLLNGHEASQLRLHLSDIPQAIEWVPVNAPSGAAYFIEWSLGGPYFLFNSSSIINSATTPYVHNDTGGDGHGLDLVASGGTAENIYYQVTMTDGGSTTYAVSPVLAVAINHA